MMKYQLKIIVREMIMMPETQATGKTMCLLKPLRNERLFYCITTNTLKCSENDNVKKHKKYWDHGRVDKKKLSQFSKWLIVCLFHMLKNQKNVSLFP